jgi:predicted nucleic-acid-binding protein
MENYFINVQEKDHIKPIILAQTDKIEIAKEIAGFYKKLHPEDEFFITKTITLENVVVIKNYEI